MEFVKGVKINDVDGLKELGVNTQKVTNYIPKNLPFKQLNR